MSKNEIEELFNKFDLTFYDECRKYFFFKKERREWEDLLKYFHESTTCMD